ncbi:MAG: response regulator [Bdellovibrionales bacterium]
MSRVILSPLSKFNVLIVEDDQLMQKLVHDVLDRLGFKHIFRASNGHQAIQQIEAAPIDFIICDWRMPDMDGISLVKQLRDMNAPNCMIPVIMLTGNAEPHHIEIARDVGVTEYLVKPFTVKELHRRINEIIEHPREFVLTENYKGPSRRRRVDPVKASKQERRNGNQPMPVKWTPDGSR